MLFRSLEKAQRAETAKSSSDDLDQLVEQVKAAMAGADPRTDVVFVVRKEESEELQQHPSTEDQINTILKKHFGKGDQRKGLFT